MSLHRDVLAAAIMRATSASAFIAATEAEAILDELARHGWRITDVADRAEQARARHSDRATSKAAADAIDDLTDRQVAVLYALFEQGPGTDGDIADRYDGLRERFGDIYPLQSPQSLRSRRAELTAAGHVVDTGERGLSEYGRPCTIWAAADATIGSAPR